MPTYEYECKSCGHRFEIFQSITASPLRKCPECSTLALRRVIGPGAGIIFKGSGFYETDYKRSRSSMGSSGSSKPKDSPSSSDSGSSPSTPASSTESKKSDKPKSSD